MNEKDLKKLNRKELLEIMLAQGKEIERLNLELEQYKQQLNNKQILIKDVGNIAQASLQLNGVFEACQNACNQYLENIQMLELQKIETLESYKVNLKNKVEAILDETEKKCNERKRECELECQAIIENMKAKYEE